MRKLLALILCACCALTGFSQIPSINNLAPSSGAVGSNVNIIGSNLGTNPANIVVYFGAVRAQVNTANGTTVQVTVPAGATYDYVTLTVGGLTAYSEKPFIVIFPGGGTIDAGTFSTQLTLPLGDEPRFILFRDLDNDGKGDLVSPSVDSDILSVYRNTSIPNAISFAPKFDLTTNNEPREVVAGDLDGDGLLDLAVVNTFSNNISVFRNISTTGNIAFAAKVDFATNDNPRNLVIKDIDGDGRPDMVSSDHNDRSVTVLRNTTTGIGSINFAAGIDISVGGNPRGLAIQDLDGDGRQDIVVVNDFDGNLSVLRNNASGTNISFDSAEDFNTGLSPRTVSIGDLDGDNKYDLVVTNAISDNIAILRNTGSGGNPINFNRSTLTVGDEPLAAVLTDLDGDGRVDIAVANATNNGVGGSVSVFRNTSSGTLSFSGQVVYDTEDDPPFIVSGDFDGDGQPDIATANSNTPGSISILRNIVGPPKIASIRRLSPSSPSTNQSSVTFQITFTEPVTGVNRNDFALITTSGSISGSLGTLTTINSSVYNLSIVSVSGNGTFGLLVLSNPGIRDLSNNDFNG